MTSATAFRDQLWEIATTQLGFVTAQQANELGISHQAIQMLVHRGTLTTVAYGVYRFPRYPTSQYDPYMLAVLWTGVPEACLSHETALDAYAISDINPNTLHVTVSKRRRLRRANPDQYAVHYQDLSPDQIGWWQEIPTVTPATAIRQCLADGTPTYLLRQALERGVARGYLTTPDHTALAAELESRRVS